MSKKIIRFSLIFIMFVFSVVLFACDKEEEITIDANYINEHLDASEFKSLNYTKEILLSDVSLYSEVVTTVFNGSKYTVSKSIKELNPSLPTDSLYNETTTNEELTSFDNPISLEIKNEYFSEITVNDKYLSGKINDANAKDVLKIENAKDVFVQITLNNNLKVDYIKITYVDSLNSFNVMITAKYNY